LQLQENFRSKLSAEFEFEKRRKYINKKYGTLAVEEVWADLSSGGTNDNLAGELGGEETHTAQQVLKRHRILPRFFGIPVGPISTSIKERRLDASSLLEGNNGVNSRTFRHL
jgi:hypothetical protein